jgi:hypothetical protein
VIEFEGTIDAALLERLHRSSPRSRVTLIVGALCFAAGVIGFILQPPPFDIARFGMPIFAAAMGGYLLTRGLAKPVINAQLNTRISGAASEERLTVHELERSEHLAWSEFSHALVRDDLVMLYHAQFFAQIFVREFFRDENDWTAFRDLVARRVRPLPMPTTLRIAGTILLWAAIIAALTLAYPYFTRSG